MTTVERLHGTLNTLGLKAVEARLEGLLEQAAKKEPSYADFLDELLGCEVDARRSRYLRARLQLAHLPFLKTFDQFDFAFQPSIDERQVRELRTLRFVHEASNMIFLGPPGVGKTHLSVALAEASIKTCSSGARIDSSSTVGMTRLHSRRVPPFPTLTFAFAPSMSTGTSASFLISRNLSLPNPTSVKTI